VCQRFPIFCLLFSLAVNSPPAIAADCVILLHGLGRTPVSLNRIERSLLEEDFLVANIQYPSRRNVIEELAMLAVEEGVQNCRQQGAEGINFLTHSMGGILVRHYLEDNVINGLHRVVMLAPPNQGSEIVDAYRNVPGYQLLSGPAGLQLGTDPDSVPSQLGSVAFELGVIAGNKTINFILSQFLKNPDDGKVSVVSTRVEGMCAFIEMSTTHPMMMRNRRVIAEAIRFLQTGRFEGDKAENDLC